MVFSKRKCRQNVESKLNGASLEIVDTYTYLGILINYNGSFTEAI